MTFECQGLEIPRTPCVGSAGTMMGGVAGTEHRGAVSAPPCMSAPSGGRLWCTQHPAGSPREPARWALWRGLDSCEERASCGARESARERRAPAPPTPRRRLAARAACHALVASGVKRPRPRLCH